MTYRSVRRTDVIYDKMSNQRNIARVQHYRPSISSVNKDNIISSSSPPASCRTNLFSAIPRRRIRKNTVSRGTYEPSRLCRVCDLNMRDPTIRNIPRAGVIFYTLINDELHLCFGRDRVTGELTDFGGGKQINENPINCAIREGNEESRYAFSKISVQQVQYFSCLYSSKMLIIFVPVVSSNDMDIRMITANNFNERKFLNYYQRKDRRYNEISEIVWLNETQICDIFSNRPTISMFAKVRRFIYSCDLLSQNINTMKRILKGAVPEYLSQDLTEEFKLSCGSTARDTEVNEAVKVADRFEQTVHLAC